MKTATSTTTPVPSPRPDLPAGGGDAPPEAVPAVPTVPAGGLSTPGATRVKPADPRTALGHYGERMAVRYLGDQGLTVVARNWRCPQGEIDIVALDGDCLVVCEVKTRRTTSFGSPVEAVTVVKLARLRRLAALWLAAHDTHAADVRVDVVGVLRPRRGACTVEHLVGVGA